MSATMKSIDAPTEQALKKMLTLEEGYSLKPYRDTFSNITIGIGRNLSGVGLSDEEVGFLFTNDLLRAETGLIAQVDFYTSLDMARKAVLLDMCFNLGIDKLLGFEVFLSALRSHSYDLAATAMLASAWAKQVGYRAVKLAEIMRDGVLEG